MVYIDAAAPFCTGGSCRIIQDGVLNYWDGSHMTRAAAGRVMALIDRALVGKSAPVLP